jgi:hypothetical protein
METDGRRAMSEKTIQEQIDYLDAEIQRIKTMTIDLSSLPAGTLLFSEKSIKEFALKTLREQKEALIKKLP